MKRIVTISFCLFLLAGLKGQARALLSGSYKCFLPQGTFDGGQTYTLPVLYHYNPNGTAQNIRRVRIFGAAGGAALYDQSYPVSPKQNLPPPVVVPPFGSIPIGVLIQSGVTIPPNPPTVDVGSEAVQGLQFIVNWSQTTDTAAPIPRADLFHFEIDVDPAIVFSVGQATCP